MKQLRIAATALLVCGTCVWSQETGDKQGASGPGVRNGLHLYEVSVSTGSSFFNGLSVNGGTGGGCNCFTLGSASAGYSRSGAHNEFNVAYTPSFWNRFGSNGVHSLDQSLQFNYESRFQPKWTLSASGSANDTSVEQLLFVPSFAPSAAIGATAADQLASFVTSSLTPVEPATTLLYGGRVLNFGGRAAITYRPTSRLRISLGGGEFQAQTRKDGTAAANTVVDVVPRTRYQSVEMDLGYSLTPLSEIGAEVSTLTYHTVFGDYRTVLSQGSYARKLSPRWSAVVQGGIGTYMPLGSLRTGAGSSFAGGANMGYSGPRNSVQFGYQRSIGDLYGLAASSTSGFQTTWKWRMPGRNWATYMNVGRQRLTGGAVIAAATNWQATAGITRPLSQHTWMSLSYGYLMDTIAPVTVYNSLSAHVIRLTLSWTPIAENQPAGANFD